MTYGDTSNWGYPKMTLFYVVWNCLHHDLMVMGRRITLADPPFSGAGIPSECWWEGWGPDGSKWAMGELDWSWLIYFFRSDMSWFIILSDTLGFDAHQAFCWLNPRPRSECIEIWRRYPTNRPSLIMPAKTCGWNPTRRECKQIQRLQVWGQEFQGTPFWQEIPCAMWDMFYLFLIFHVGIG